MSKTRPEWKDEVSRRGDGLLALRRDFHRHPELSHHETRTAEIIAERLHAARLDVRTGVGGTGVVGVLHGDRPGRTVAWRADIDALPLTELLDAPFASGTPGVMHACGHDGHTAIAITLAEIMAERRDDVPGTAVFIFQPAEEVLAGARPMIEAGVLDDPHVDGSAKSRCGPGRRWRRPTLSASRCAAPAATGRCRICPSIRSPRPRTSCSACRASCRARSRPRRPRC
jgi:amidohydrolase